ncbi:hypothetical protein Smp_197660 [Schistosoma mansoni]|uniref:hypothetical protein n=1 Tax=Schistosoma mansoni TaxID=6183 RepID=UPI00022C846C|nr:hypothetical protein Smp_197660 [Schistosoma mansoni]|eukprot:XP_018645359.1 hypothetical protein Smp_197660 [Schistosoma mansoni]
MDSDIFQEVTQEYAYKYTREHKNEIVHHGGTVFSKLHIYSILYCPSFKFLRDVISGRITFADHKL